MLISNGSLLNVLLANNNKVLNEVLKEADSKTLETLVKSDQANSTTASGALKQLFENLTDGTNSKQTIENLLKNSTVFKELGNFSTNFSALLKAVQSDETLKEFMPKLENMSKNIKDLDASSLKEQIKNSGVFLENKLSNTQNSKLETILKDISTILKSIDTPQAKQVNESINRVLQNVQNQANQPTQVSQTSEQGKPIPAPVSQNNTQTTQTNQLSQNNASQSTQNQVLKQDVPTNQTQQNAQASIQKDISASNQVKINNPLLQASNQTTVQGTAQAPINQAPNTNGETVSSLKTLTQNLQNLSNSLNPSQVQNLTSLTNELKSLINNASLIESKFENILNQTQNKVPNQQSQTNQQAGQVSQNLQTAQNTVLNQPINPQASQVQNQTAQTIILNQQNQVPAQQLNQSLSNPQTVQTTQNQTQTIQNVQQNQVPNQQINPQQQTTVNQTTQQNPLQSSQTNPNTAVQQTINLNLDTQNNTLKVVQNSEIQAKESINIQTREILNQIKNDIIQNPSLVQNKNILPIIDNLLKMDNFFIKNEQISNMLSNANINQNAAQAQSQNNISTFSNNFASNLSPLLASLKDGLESVQNQSFSGTQNHISKLIGKVEHIIQDLELSPEGKSQTKVNEDTKTILLQLKEELAPKQDAKSLEMMKQVDKLLTQIDFHQLSSIVSNSNFVYVPFFWEMLEDGTINMKRAEDDKFYCQINLNLKDFGKVDLMLALYDTNKMDLTIYAQRDHFKLAIRDNMQDLKVALNNADLIPVNIKLLDMQEDNKESNTPSQNYLNNLYNQNLGSSVDIRA